MLSVPKLKVVWPGGDAVFVEVDVEPLVGRRWREPEDDKRPSPTAISSADLLSRDSMLSFLRRVTQGEASGATVYALIFEPRDGDLLRVLAVPRPTPAEFEVRLPDG